MEVPTLQKCFSAEDWILLDAMGCNPIQAGCPGRFLTMHKRRRKKLMTRTLSQDHAILDDIHHGQVQVCYRLWLIIQVSLTRKRQMQVEITVLRYVGLFSEVQALCVQYKLSR